jgi:hypothetical protein
MVIAGNGMSLIETSSFESCKMIVSDKNFSVVSTKRKQKTPKAKSMSRTQKALKNVEI